MIASSTTWIRSPTISRTSARQASARTSRASRSGVPGAAGSGSPSASSSTDRAWLGVKVGSSEKLFTQGSLQETDNPLDIAIQGDGFFQVTLPDGTTSYTRDGSFKRDANGSMVTSDGYFVQPQITIPQNATSVQVGPDGTVTAVIPGTAQPQQLGQIQLARFVNPAGLSPIGGQNLYTATAASGAPIVSQPGLNGAGSLQGGYLENSNVQIVNEIVNMIVAQRAYEANSKAISTSDEMLNGRANESGRLIMRSLAGAVAC